GGGSAADYSFSFTIEDPVPPTVLTTIPVNGANDAGIGTTVSVVFSEAMNEATVTNDANFSLTETGETAEIVGVLSYTADANTTTFTPDVSFKFSTSYTGTVTTGVTDAEGSPLAADYTFSFTTASAAGSLSFTDIIVANNRIVPGSTDPMRIFIETPEGLNAADVVTIGVYTSTGRRVATLTTAGETYADVIARQPIVWDGTNGRGQPLGPGLYFVQVSSVGYRRALRVMIVR
ncbi:MAG: Ig-like domain-containing protein, partial [Spirochaetaceae bacterium]|nr:Ig-like domain-containing protein [Spirochaetaceae bacterium]